MQAVLFTNTDSLTVLFFYFMKFRSSPLTQLHPHPDPSLTIEFCISSAGIWTLTGNMTESRSKHTASVLLNGKVLVIGGSSYESRSITVLYDPVTGTWARTGNTTESRSKHTASVLLTGKVLLTGGSTSGSTAELYDPATGTWTPTGNTTASRFEHTASVLPNGKVLVVGGSIDRKSVV